VQKIDWISITEQFSVMHPSTFKGLTVHCILTTGFNSQCVIVHSESESMLENIVGP